MDVGLFFGFFRSPDEKIKQHGTISFVMELTYASSS